MRRVLPLLALALALTAGCATSPFPPMPRVPLADVAPQAALEIFRDKAPSRFQTVSSVVFEFAGRAMTGLGSLEMDTEQQRFRLSCLNPMGVKILELSGDAGVVQTEYIMPPLAERGDLGKAVGRDIERIYFDLLPSPSARSSRGTYRLTFVDEVPGGSIKYVYAGKDFDLAEKIYYQGDTVVWRVSYHEYADVGGKRYPRGIVLSDETYGYRLTVRQREFNL